MLAGGVRSVERTLALAPVEAAEMAARERAPRRRRSCRCRRRGCRKPGSGTLIDFGQAGRRVEAQEGRRAAEYADRVPDRAVHRARHHRIGPGARHDALVLGRIGRLVGLDELVALAVAVGVEDERRPALRLRRVAGLVEHLGVDPAGHRPGAAEPQRVVGVVAELQVMRAEAGVDEGVLHRLRIEHRHLAGRPLEREHLRGRMIGALLAEGRVVHRRARSPRATPGPSGRTWRCDCWPWCPRSSRRPSRATAPWAWPARHVRGRAPPACPRRAPAS